VLSVGGGGCGMGGRILFGRDDVFEGFRVVSG